MRKGLVTAVQREVRGEVAQLGPPRFEPSSESVPMAVCLYTADLSDSLTGYILFQSHRREDSFTVEVACTRNGRWPALYFRRPEVLDALSEDGDVRFRLARFWGEEDHWWSVTPDSVSDATANVMLQLRRYALPYFSIMARNTGLRSS
jgi:hypothetical protein